MFVTITRQQFESYLPEQFQTLDLPRTFELVYQIETDKKNLAVRIYSSIDKQTNLTRDNGKDAVRLVFWDCLNDKPVGKSSRINRVEGKTTVGERIQAKIAECLSNTKDQNIVDFNYVRAVLEANTWSPFAESLLENLDKYRKLSDNQLAYVLGETNPKGKNTFEALAKKKNPDFENNFYNREVKDEGTSIDKKEQQGPDDVRQCDIDTLFESPEGETGKGTEQPSIHPTANVEKASKEKHQNVLIKSDGTDIQLVPTSKHSYYQYPFESFNPVQSIVYRYKEHNNNILVGANTSAGKTIAAELVIDETLKKGEKVIYLSPLKSLTQEKYDDWSVRYKDKVLTIMTGDYTLSDKMKKQLKNSDIIVMTSEMLDSRTRKMMYEKNFWLRETGLIIVDESHILSTDRGHAVEAGIMRFSKINPSARIVFLSATMPNVEELGDWLTLLNKKKTVVINCNWRPVELQLNIVPHPVYKNYYDTDDAKKKITVELAMQKPDEKYLIFVHAKNTGRDIVRKLNAMGEPAVFHSAESDLKTKNETEAKFKDRNNGIRVLVSTSVTAWGVNLPARNVIICGVHRGLNEVDQLDIIQMAGRAGRYGIDDAGFVFLVVPNGTESFWQNIFVNPRPVTSVLNKHATMAFHALAEIATKQIDSIPSLHEWYSRSLAYKQGQQFSMEAAKFLMEDLYNMQMVSSVTNPKLRSLGKVSAGLYFSPYDVWKWYKNFQALKNLQDAGEPVNDSVLSWAIGDIPSNDMGYVPRNIENDFSSLRTVVYGYLSRIGISANEVTLALVSAVGCHANLSGENSNGTLGIIQRNIKYDISRTVQALNWIDRSKGEWGFDNLWKILPIRIMYGVPMELVDLIRLPGIGAARAKKIYDLGITSVKDVANIKNGKVLKKVFADNFVKQLQKYAREELKNEA